MMTGWDFVAHWMTACWPNCFYCCCAVFQEAEFVELRGDKLLDSLDGVQRDVERKHSVERKPSDVEKRQTEERKPTIVETKQPNVESVPAEENYDNWEGEENWEGEDVHGKEEW